MVAQPCVAAPGARQPVAGVLCQPAPEGHGEVVGAPPPVVGEIWPVSVSLMVDTRTRGTVSGVTRTVRGRTGVINPLLSNPSRAPTVTVTTMVVMLAETLAEKPSGTKIPMASNGAKTKGEGKGFLRD